MKKTKTAICALICVCLIFAVCGCGEKAASPEEATATLTSTRAYGKNTADKAMDGDKNTGWVSAGIASEINIPYLQVEFDRVVEVGSVTFDDSFAAGRTAALKEYETVPCVVKNPSFAYTSPPEEARDAASVFTENGNGWRAQAAPSTDAPQAFYAEFRAAVLADRILLDNDAAGVIPVSFRVYVSDKAVDAAHKLDPEYEGWREVMNYDENGEYTLVADFDQGIEVQAVLYVVYEQSESNACLNKLLLQRKLDSPDTAHYPEDFNILYSLDGEEFETVEVRKNTSPVYTHTFDQKQKLKYIRYMPVTEYGGNKPSMGEITVR